MTSTSSLPTGSNSPEGYTEANCLSVALTTVATSFNLFHIHKCSTLPLPVRFSDAVYFMTANPFTGTSERHVQRWYVATSTPTLAVVLS
jgi:hypothetical protein